MKIFISKNEDFTLDFQKDFLKEYDFSPVLNKFEILIHNPEKNSRKIIGLSFLENVLPTRNSVPFQRLEILGKFKVKNQVSDIQLFFSILTIPKIRSSLESNIMNSNPTQEIQLDIEMKKMQNSTKYCLETDQFDLFQVKCHTNTHTLLENNQVEMRKETIEFINRDSRLSKFSLDFDLGKCLKEINTLDVISDIVKLNFQSQNFLKTKELLNPKRWLPMNLNHFLPNSVSKSKKELDLNVNWNYISVLKDLYAVNDNIHNLVLGKEWKFKNDDTRGSQKLKSFKIGFKMEEIGIENTIDILSNNEIHESIEIENSKQPLMLETRSSMDTKVMVDRFMIKRKRTNSNVHQEKECKQAKVQQTISKDFSTQKLQEVSMDLVDLEIPKFDQENAKKHKYIGNSTFFSKRELVKLLESKYCIELIERNLDICEDDISPRKIQREDVIIDEKTCIVYIFSV